MVVKKKGEEDPKAKKRKRLQAQQKRLMRALESQTTPATPSNINFNQRAESSRDLGERSNAGHCAGRQCGDPIKIGEYKAKKATSGSNRKRLTNVGSSKGWNKRKRQQARLDKVNEKLKGVRRPSKRLANPRFL